MSDEIKEVEKEGEEAVTAPETPEEMPSPEAPATA